MEELKDKYEADYKEMKKQLTVQNEINALLLEKIQKYKSQKYISEEHISNSQSLSFLRDEAKKLISKLDDQHQEINQLRQIEFSYKKQLKSQNEVDEKSKLLLTSQKLEIATQKDKLVILTQKLENLSAQVQGLQ